MDAKKLLCLIAGSSGCGKTSIAQKLVTKHHGTSSGKNTSAVLLHQDNYFTKPFLPYNKRLDDSFEDSSGIDWETLIKDIESHASQEETNVIIVEGHLLGDASAMFQQFKNRLNILVVLISCSKETCKTRRLDRKFRSDDEWHELSKYIDTFVWPSFLTYGVRSMTSMRNFVTDSLGCDDVAKKKCILLEIDSDNKILEDSVDAISHQINGFRSKMGLRPEKTREAY